MGSCRLTSEKRPIGRSFSRAWRRIMPDHPPRSAQLSRQSVTPTKAGGAQFELTLRVLRHTRTRCYRRPYRPTGCDRGCGRVTRPKV